MCPRVATAYRRDSFVECRENPRLTDSCHDAVSLHIGTKVRADTSEDDGNPMARQIIEQIAYGLRGGVVYIRDRARVDDEPANRRRRALDEGTHLDGEDWRLRRTNPNRNDKQ